MDMNALAARGRSTTRTGWLTNPLRRLLWRLIAPYFRAAGEEIEAATETRLEARLGAERERLQAELRALLEAERAAARAALAPELAALRALLSAGLDAQRKDTNAIAMRLASLDDEAADAAQARAQLAARLGRLEAAPQARGDGG